MLELPDLHEDANARARSAKRTYLWLTLASLLALTAAAAVGAVSGAAPAVVTVALFLVALFIRLYLASNRPVRAWYDGRAAAESVKTLAWRYTVGGEPFPLSLADVDADRRYVELVQRLLTSLREIYVPAAARGANGAITPTMRESRRLALSERRALYLQGRVDDQEAWYARRAASHQRRYTLWGIATLVLELGGVLGGVIIIATNATIDVLGIFGAAAAATIAWMETNQYANLAHSYSNAAHELGAVRVLEAHVTSEEEWADFVATAEEAVSREHVTWAASGGSATADLFRKLNRT